MDQKKKAQLEVLLRARKRAEKVLETRREAERKLQEYKQRKEANQERMRQFGRELTSLAEECGILALAEQAACERGGRLRREVGYYIDYGFNSSNLQRALVEAELGRDLGELRASHLGLKIRWEAPGLPPGAEREVEVRVHRNGRVTFHNFLLPVFPFLWRRFPGLLERLLAHALKHPRDAEKREAKGKHVYIDDCTEKEDNPPPPRRFS